MAVLNRQWKKKIEVKEQEPESAGHSDGKHKRGGRRTLIDHADDGSSQVLLKSKSTVGKSDAAGTSTTQGNAGARSRLGGAGKDMTVDVHSGPSKHDLSDATPGMMMLSPNTAVKAPGAGRRFTVSLDQQAADFSPRWKVLAVRRAACKLDFKEPKKGDEEDEIEGADKAEADFLTLAGKLQTWVSQCNMQMTKLLADIRKRHAEDSAILENDTNLNKLRETIFLVSTANYHLTKWLHQLDPKATKKPARPEGADKDAGVQDYFAEVQFGLSKMDKLASTLGPKLFQIVTDTRKMRRTADGQPLSPKSKLSSVQAQKRGIQDVAALNGLVGHLEYLLDNTQSLAYRPVAVKGLGAAVKVLIAASRFKKKLFNKKK